MALFDSSITPYSKSFLELAENAKSLRGAEEYLEHMERLWHAYQPFASPDFLRQLLADDGKFYSLTWEMLLGAMLLDKGYELQASKDDNRPDLCLIYEEKRVWIECCLPTGGDPSKPNSVPEIPSDGEFHNVDPNKSVLRCTQQLAAKKKQHLSWISQEICKPDEPFIIAINGRNLQLSIYNHSLPQIIRALYGTGDLYAIFDANNPEHSESGYLFKPKIDKSETEPISTTFFLDTDNNHINGVLFSTDWICHYSSTPNYCYVENVSAANRTGISFAEFCQTYEYGSNQIRMH